MNIHERILNILLEARVEMFIQDRLDERNKENRARVKASMNPEGSKQGLMKARVAIRNERVARVGKGDPGWVARRKEHEEGRGVKKPMP